MLNHEITSIVGKKRSRKRIGRGVGSGKGKTCGRGHKGQGSRSGGTTMLLREGGQMPIHRRLPKRGFTNIFRKKFIEINLRDLANLESGSTVDEPTLIRCGLVKGKRDGIKLLGDGEVKHPLSVKVHRVSKKARQKIEAAGGTVEVI